VTTYWRRRLARHASIAALGVGAVVLGVIALESDDLIWKASITSGWVAGMLLAVTLLLGPVNVLAGRPNPVSFDLRRDVGLWAAVLGVAHSAIGLLVHFRGRPWEYFVWPADRGTGIPLRYDLFGAAAWSGLATTLLIVVLGAASNDLALRWLGTARWKRLQRTNYVLFALVALHGFAFQALENRSLGLVLVLGALVVVTGGVQSWGFLARRHARRRPPTAP
jgi:methionine sulfoxide reductase heme-binding subunit